MVARVLEKTGSTVQAQGDIYKAAVQSVILYGRESWVVTGEMLKVLEGFHHRVERRIMGLTEKYGAGGEWEYPSVVEAMEATGLHPIGEYIRRRQATIAERVYCRPIYEIYTEAERISGTSQMVRWWDQDTVNEPEE